MVEHTICKSENDAFVTIHFFLGAAIALWSLYIAFTLRNIRAEFNESVPIGVSMFVLGVCALVAIPIVLSSTSPTMSLVVKLCAIYFAVLGSVGVMYTRQVFYLITGRNRVASIGGSGTMATGLAQTSANTATCTPVTIIASKGATSEEDIAEIENLKKQKEKLLDQVQALESGK